MNRAEALIASDSFDFRDRLRSIPYVGKYGDDDCRRAMVRLLTDIETRVCEEAGRFLIALNEVAAAELLFIGLAVSYEQQRAQILWEIRNAWKSGKFDLEGISDSILGDGDFLSRSGVHDVLQWLGLDGLKG
jgi:hypothetical protein